MKRKCLLFTALGALVIATPLAFMGTTGSAKASDSVNTECVTKAKLAVEACANKYAKSSYNYAICVMRSINNLGCTFQ